jgi:hypothetical protein
MTKGNKMTREEKKLQLIIEEPYFSPVEILETNDIQIIKEEYDRQTKFPKVRFKAILQEADVVNKNGRKYPKQILQEVVEYFNNIIKIRKGIPGELNHPLVEGELAKQRMARIDLDNIAVIYKKFDFDGKYVIAEAVTASTRKGVDLYGLIVEDGYNVGFSLRALGSVKPIFEENGQKVLLVEKIHKPVTYDVVDNPSHAVAKILELNENEILNTAENKSIVLTENTDTIYIPVGAYKISEKTIEQAKYDKDLKELVDSILEDSVSITINGETVRICKDDRCIITSLENLIDDILDKYFPPEDISNKSSLYPLYPVYQKACKRLLLDRSKLFGPDRYEFLPYFINRLINPSQQLFLNSAVFNNPYKLFEDICYTINNNLYTEEDNIELDSAGLILTEESLDIFEEIESIEQYEKLIESIDYNELEKLIDRLLENEKYYDINEILDIQTLDEEIDFYLSQLDLDKQEVLNQLEEIAEDLVVDDVI